jgi:ketosteroid isomerase-like protein
MSQEDVEIPRLLFGAFDRGDRTTFERLVAPDVEWHSLAAPLLGVDMIRGREAFLKFVWQDVQRPSRAFACVRRSSRTSAPIGSWS